MAILAAHFSSTNTPKATFNAFPSTHLDKKGCSNDLFSRQGFEQSDGSPSDECCRCTFNVKFLG
jgi:hypothetical protein